MKRFLIFLILTFFVFSVSAQIGSSFSYSEDAILAPTSRANYDWFGSPCLLGDRMMVGGMYAVAGCTTGCGAGYVDYYEKNLDGDWVLIQRIESPEPEDCDHFGSDIAIDGDWAFIGAWWDDNNDYTDVGKVYRFQKTGGQWVHSPPDLLCPNPNNDNLFGVSLEINDGFAFIGSLKENGGNGSESGTVYFYTVTSPGTLTLQGQINAPLAMGHDAGDNFGSDIGYADSTLVISAYRDDNGGSAYIFKPMGSSWNCVQKITGSDTQVGDGWGEGIDIDKGVILSGAFLDNTPTMNCVGSAYAFTEDETGTWVEREIFRPANARAWDYFGSRISLKNGVAAIGAFKRDEGTTDGGAVYFYSVYKSYSVKYLAGLNGSILGDTSQTVNHGDSSTMVTAVPDLNYVFVGWSDNSIENPRKDYNITAEFTVTASFEESIPDSIIFEGGGGCFDALNEITTGSTAAIILPGESTTLISGNSINLLPDFHAQLGSYLHAYITTNGSFCTIPSKHITHTSTSLLYVEKTEKNNFETKVNELKFEEPSLYIYPNPTKGIAKVEWSNFEGHVQITVFNLIGEKMTHRINQNNLPCTFNLTNYKKGVYFVRVQSEKSQKIQKILLY